MRKHETMSRLVSAPEKREREREREDLIGHHWLQFLKQ